MDFQITSKCELNVLNAKTNPSYVNDLAIRYRLPAIVCDPSYIAPLLAQRAARGGNYQIIAAIDFPNGKNFAIDKLKRTHPDYAAADGYEILVSTGRSEIETRNELKSLREFVKMQNGLLQVRWCLSMLHKDEKEAVAALKGMAKYPPAYVRIDSHTTIPNITLEDLTKAVATVKQHVPYPIKVSGNVTVETIKALGGRSVRFDVDVEGLKQLVASLDKNEAKILDMPVSDGTDVDPLSKLDGLRRQQAKNLMARGGLKVQRKSRLRG